MADFRRLYIWATLAMALSRNGNLARRTPRRLNTYVRLRATCWGLLLALAGAEPALAFDVASEPPSKTAALPSADATSPLSLAEAAHLALTDQPILTGRQAIIDSDERQAVAAAQLPDPKLTSGIKDLPIDTSEAFNLRADNFTEYTVGLIQDLPRADKRRLKGERKRLEADTERAALANDRRAIRRDTSLAWLDVYEAEQGLALAGQLTVEATLQVQSLEKDYGNGKASQADWLAAKVEASLAEDKAHDWLHHAERSRAGLARWIGDAAQRPLADDLSPTAPPPELPGLITAVDHHPVIDGLDKQIEASATDIALARQAYKPDVSVEGYFAYRPGYSDFIGIQFTIDLPYFTKNRQDPELAAALEKSHASTDRKRDALRELHTQVSQIHLDWQHYRQRVGEFDTTILPNAERRIQDARSSYQAGRGSFDAVLLARRSLIDLRLQRLALAVEAARAQVRLQYFVTTQDLLGDSP
ncbi:MAG: TolC family protein [Proteobacteria bacterium]|nr:TolC family protein [Pseudomonadota bacterium]